MEIEKQPDTEAAHAEIGQHLRVVCWNQLGNRFDFNNHLAIYENVGAEAFVELDVVVNDWNCDLTLEGDASLRAASWSFVGLRAKSLILTNHEP